VTEQFEFIDAEYAAYRGSCDICVPSIVKMCRWMEVSRLGVGDEGRHLAHEVFEVC
jgi:hypothetical protein